MKRMRWAMTAETLFRRTLLCLAFWTMAYTGVIGALAAGAKREDAEKFFISGFIPQIHIEIAKTNLVKLQRNARDYVRATIREGDKVYEEVAIHLKGAAGSFRQIDADKPAFTLNF